MQECSIAQAFWRNERGSIAVTFALTAVALIGCAGIAVDFARAYSNQSTLQQNLDATLLHVVQEKALDPNYDEQNGAQIYMEGLNRLKHVIGSTTVSINQVSDTKYSAVARSTVPTTLLRVFTNRDIAVSVASEAGAENKPVHVALVLDNTGSMAGTKLTALKSAAADLITTAFSSPGASRNVKVSLVPFSDYVNVGVNNRNQSWIDVKPDTAVTTPNVCKDVTVQVLVPGSCQDEDEDELIDGHTVKTKKQKCKYTTVQERQCQDVTTGSKWRGCVGSRAYPLNTQDDSYSKRVPGVFDVRCGVPLMPLTNNRQTLLDTVDSMFVDGETYIPDGLLWGWTTLSPKAPFAESASSSGPAPHKIMILMTDGANTISLGATDKTLHDGRNPAETNQYTAEVCSNIKAENIELYTVAFEVTDILIKSILSDCATSPSHFFDATNETALISAFSEISKEFSPTRLTR